MSFSGDSSSLFDEDGFGHDSRFASQRFDSFINFGDADSVADDGVFVKESMMDSPLPVYCCGGEFELNPVDLVPELKGEDEKGSVLREWRRLNAIRLAEKDKLEKEMRAEILVEADEYKADFYKRRHVTVDKNKVSNREKQKTFLENQEKFHKEADTNYWKAIADLVPNEVPAIEKRGKKDKDKKKPSITVIQGPKPGKPTDLSRMRQIILKLKHNTPPHLRPAPPAPVPDAKVDSPPVLALPSQAIASA
ncbi:hypothetical protein QQ045_027909 [Rhodiola kirilowii]